MSYHVGGYDLPLFAVLGAIGTPRLVARHDRSALCDGVAPVGHRLAGVGMVVYMLYRRSQHLPLTDGDGAGGRPSGRPSRSSTARS